MGKFFAEKAEYFKSFKGRTAEKVVGLMGLKT